MPAEDFAIRERQAKTAMEWQDYWQSIDETEEPSMDPQVHKVVDKEAIRKQREAASGLYVDTTATHPHHIPTDKNEVAIDGVRKPRLERPEMGNGDLESLMQDMNRLLVRIKETDEEFRNLPPQESDVYLYKKLIDTVLQQRHSREESSLVSQERLLKHQEIKQNIYKKMCELREKQIETDKSMQISSWVGVGLTIGIVALFVVSVVATIATGGAASPTLAASLAIAQGTLGVAQGVNTGVKGYYDHKSKGLERDHYGERVARDEHQTGIKTELHKHRDSNDWVSKHITMLRHIQKSRRAATRNT